MADSHTGRLCSEIIHSHFGTLTAKVASVILRHGRLSFPQIVHLTGIKPRTVRACILVLVQHNVLWHTQSYEGEMFDFNMDECLLRLRFGKFVWLAEQLLGKTASEVVQLILDNGKLRLPDILAHLSVSDPKSIALYTQAMYKLVSAHYLKPSTVLSHISPLDKQIKYEEEEKARIIGFPTAKELREAKEVAGARLKREEEEAEKVGLKRKAKDQLGSKLNKRKVVIEEDDVDDTVYFKVNYDRFNVYIRNEFLIKAAQERYNEGAATVLRAILKATEAAQLDMKEIHSESVSVASIIMQLPQDDDTVKSGLIHPSKKVSTSTNVKDYLGLLSAADNPTPAGKAGSFISYSSSKVQVEFEIVCRRLRKRMLETVAREKHGVEGLRILRLLLEIGKMDEKQISKLVMMAPKDVRPLLSAMAVDSLISTQEVPKSADRNPTRTFYLWYVDLRKAYSAILGDIFKTLCNISMRRRAEEDVSEVRMVLEKRERSDVSQDESLLSRLERDILAEWEKKQQKLSVLEQRMEETLFVMKDLAVLGIEDD